MASLDQAVEPILVKYRRNPDALLQILVDTQEALDWLAPETRLFIARELGIPITRVEGLFSFTPIFTTRRAANSASCFPTISPTAWPAPSP